MSKLSNDYDSYEERALVIQPAAGFPCYVFQTSSKWPDSKLAKEVAEMFSAADEACNQCESKAHYLWVTSKGLNPSNFEQLISEGLSQTLLRWGNVGPVSLCARCCVKSIAKAIAGGLSPDRKRWIRSRDRFFLPVKILSRVFRGKFLASLKRLYRNKELHCAGPSATLAEPQPFAQLLRRLYRQDWVVYAKPAFGGPMQVLRYLGRYTHRVAISNHRLLAFDGEHVTFRWKDYAHGGKHGQMKLHACEFLRRFFLHVLPKAFVRIRHFGFLANRFRAARVSLCRQLLTPLSPTADSKTTPATCANSLWQCPSCGAAMIILQRFTAAELALCVRLDSS